MRDTPSPDQWARMGESLGSIFKDINWWIGDFVKYGEAQLGDDFQQYAPDIPIEHLERCLAVSNAFPIGDRFEDLTWSHHLTALRLHGVRRRASLVYASINGLEYNDYRLYVENLIRCGA
jgi:hypothetical protein